ncbi:Hypothetical Protein FCC1311_105642 [Hondaea fermentalgiana]|uniref:Uncharacterized protein n=1 Tax=Hondaea fermentalgiana TaxID=2315210 RepID=A0A2R5H0P3_9STRA|nr:Hypothetical Protein FCC1311_105642 [Hondaea fermentalgiana]|eukprot:GBG34341.1 Hypothetical Protein FCC1311_105642 [Hondaea fermentalgiana]
MEPHSPRRQLAEESKLDHLLVEEARGATQALCSKQKRRVARSWTMEANRLLASSSSEAESDADTEENSPRKTNSPRTLKGKLQRAQTELVTVRHGRRRRRELGSSSSLLHSEREHTAHRAQELRRQNQELTHAVQAQKAARERANAQTEALKHTLKQEWEEKTALMARYRADVKAIEHKLQKVRSACKDANLRVELAQEAQMRAEIERDRAREESNKRACALEATQDTVLAQTAELHDTRARLCSAKKDAAQLAETVASLEHANQALSDKLDTVRTELQDLNVQFYQQSIQAPFDAWRECSALRVQLNERSKKSSSQTMDRGLGDGNDDQKKTLAADNFEKPEIVLPQALKVLELTRKQLSRERVRLTLATIAALSARDRFERLREDMHQLEESNSYRSAECCASPCAECAATQVMLVDAVREKKRLAAQLAHEMQLREAHTQKIDKNDARRKMLVGDLERALADRDEARAALERAHAYQKRFDRDKSKLEAKIDALEIELQTQREQVAHLTQKKQDQGVVIAALEREMQLQVDTLTSQVQQMEREIARHAEIAASRLGRVDLVPPASIGNNQADEEASMAREALLRALEAKSSALEAKTSALENSLQQARAEKTALVAILTRTQEELLEE